MRLTEEYKNEEIVAGRIAAALKKRQMTASELSEKIGVSKSTMSYYLKGRFMPKQDKIIAMSNVLGVPPSWLLGFDKNRESYAIPYKGEEVYHRFFSRNDAVSKAFREFADTLMREEQRKLSSADNKLLDRFKQLTAPNQQAVMMMIESLLAQQKAPSVKGEGS
jgi:transcriptional regulator with XRE-family HTH domain